jgi:hypothetical protein
VLNIINDILWRMIVMGKKKMDNSKYTKILDDLEKIESADEREKYLLEMTNADRDEFRAMHNQKFLDDKKERTTACSISSIKEGLERDRKNYGLYGELWSEKHINVLIEEGVLTKEEGEKRRAWEKKCPSNMGYSNAMNIKKTEKILGGLDPTEEAKAIMNKNMIAGIEKRKITLERKKQTQIEEYAAKKKFLSQTDEEVQAEIEKQKMKNKLLKDPFSDEMFGINRA